MKRFVWLVAAPAAALTALMAQDITIHLQEGQRPALAIPDLRGDGQAQPFMGAFNTTLWSDVEGSGYFKMVAKTMYPKANPQQASDWRQPPSGRPGAAIPNGGGMYMTDWISPPAQADHIAFGYTAVQNGVLVLYGYLYDLGRATQTIGARYVAASVDEAGARQIAHQFAADIIAQFGGKSLVGTHIYFTSFFQASLSIWLRSTGQDHERRHVRQRDVQAPEPIEDHAARAAR